MSLEILGYFMWWLYRIIEKLLSVCTDRIMPHEECLYGYNIWYSIEFSISHKFKTTVTIN
jgi:hypothetical protein